MAIEMRFVVTLLSLWLLPAIAWAEPRVAVRVGDHAAYGRVVFDWPDRVAYEVETSSDRVTLRFGSPATFDLAAARRMPRNMRGLDAVGGSATIALAPGAQARVFRLGNRVVVDAHDAAATAPAAERPPSRPAAQRPAPPPAAAPPPSPPAVVAPVPPPPPQAEVAAASPPAPARGLLVPAAAEVGAALLRRGDFWMLVLDAPVAFDPAGLREGPFAGAEFSRGAHASVLRIPRAAMAEPLLTRRTEGWHIEQAESPAAPRAIRAELDPGPPPRLMLRAARPDRWRSPARARAS
jgi:hypothetical protein